MTSSALPKQHEEYTKINLDSDRSRFGRLGKLLDEFQLCNAKILDVGCGPGVQFIGHMEGHEFTGIDIAEEPLVLARSNGYKHTIKHDVSKPLPFDDEQFDLIVMTDILEHVFSPFDLLLEAKRVVKHTGSILVSVPNHFFLLNRLRILQGKGLILPWSNHQEYEDWNYFHIRFFRWVSLCSMLERAGLVLEVDLTDRFNAPLPKPLMWPIVAILIKILRRLTLSRWRDLWSLHLMAVCRPRMNSSLLN